MLARRHRLRRPSWRWRVARAAKPNIYNMPVHRAFADALATGLIRTHGSGPLGLARGLIVTANNRAKQALQDGFVRQSGGGLLMPRMVAIGDLDLDESLDAAFDRVDDEPLPPAIAPIHRRLVLARLVQRHYRARGKAIDASEAVALADALGRTLDQLQIERIAPQGLAELDMAETLAAHWQQSLDLFGLVLDEWPAELARLGVLDLADRRNQLLSRAALRLAASDASFVVAAGIASAAPAIVDVLRAIAWLPQGMVVLSGVDLSMPVAEWDALGETAADAEQASERLESHPQYHLKLLLDRIGVSRDEVALWRVAAASDADAKRSRMVSNAFAPARFTGKWRELAGADKSVAGITAHVVATPAEEAQAIAIAMRGVLEQPGRTAALVTPDRGLATRVSAHLKRWGIDADDSAGRPLANTAHGALPLLVAEAAAAGFAPVELMALIKHPLVKAGDDRLDWLDGVRALDRALRGPRPAPGLDGISAFLATDPDRRSGDHERARSWWQDARMWLDPIEQALPVTDVALHDFGGAIDGVRNGIEGLCGTAAWSGVAGRLLADFMTELGHYAADAPSEVTVSGLAGVIERLMTGLSVRPPQGGHPRLFIWGLLEARLQRADVMILGGLNEGSWPQAPDPDPWLAPGIRRRLGLPGLDTRIGLSAHDFASALAAPEVMITRAERDMTAPGVASRFWLRLEAMAGGMPLPDPAFDAGAIARALDRSGGRAPAAKPAPVPPLSIRPKTISVTQVDRLKADPYAFYARSVLGLVQLDALDADPTAAWRGSAVHKIVEDWSVEASGNPARLRELALALMQSAEAHPIMRAMWQPRLLAAVDWVAQEFASTIASGRRPELFEAEGVAQISGVTLKGKADRIDRCTDGSVGIVDYKNGEPPSKTAVKAGFALQLGLLGLIAEQGGFAGGAAVASDFSYWSFAKNKAGGFGKVERPFPARPGPGDLTADMFTDHAARHFADAAGKWLTGSEPFHAKLHPQYAPYAEYDQLMRFEEWYGI